MDQREYYNIYDKEGSHFYYVTLHRICMTLLKKAFSKGSLKILDDGCGTGLLLKKMSRFGEVSGIDISPLAVALAQKRGMVSCQVGSALEIPFPKGHFDVVTSIDILSQVSREEGKILLREAKRVLKPNGTLLLRTPAYRWLRGSHDKHVHVFLRYSKKELESLIHENGLKILKITHTDFFIFFPVVLKRFFQRLFKAPPASDIQQLPNWLNQLMIGLGKIETQWLFRFGLPIGVGLLVMATASPARVEPQS